jgi:formate/nitrite transporter FocA (FNT family)
MLTLFIRGMLCNWMVSTGVVGGHDLDHRVAARPSACGCHHAVLLHGFEHSIVNMFLFPSGLLLGGKFTIMDYLIWNEIPTVVGNLVGGLTFTGLTLYATHYKTGAQARRELSLRKQGPAR